MLSRQLWRTRKYHPTSGTAQGIQSISPAHFFFCLFFLYPYCGNLLRNQGKKSLTNWDLWPLSMTRWIVGLRQEMGSSMWGAVSSTCQMTQRACLPTQLILKTNVTLGDKLTPASRGIAGPALPGLVTVTCPHQLVHTSSLASSRGTQRSAVDSSEAQHSNPASWMGQGGAGKWGQNLHQFLNGT